MKTKPEKEISFNFILFNYFNTGRPIQHELFFDGSVHKKNTKYDEGKNTVTHVHMKLINVHKVLNSHIFKHRQSLYNE